MRNVGAIEVEDIVALLELAARAPKSQAEQRWLLALAARIDAASQQQEEENPQEETTFPRV